jgi:hypothetical protein
MRIGDRIELPAESSRISTHNLEPPDSRATARRRSAGDDAGETNRAERDNYAPRAWRPSNAFTARRTSL